MGTALPNFILDIRLYQVEFNGDENEDLTANFIAESMYAQYDAEGNEYLLLDSQIGY